MSEQIVNIASKIYACRKTAKFLHGADYPKKMDQYKEIIRSYMKLHKDDVLVSALNAAQDCNNQPGEGVAILNLMSAAAEMLEPTY